MKSALLSIAQAALDRALRLDPQAGAILAPLTGKRIAVQIVGAVPVRLTVEFAHERILLREETVEKASEFGTAFRSEDGSAHAAGDADVRICGSASALAMLARGIDQLPSTAKVSVHGDIALLQKARAAVARLRPDFDEPLARLLGDELAYPVSRALREAASMARRTVREVGDDCKEFLGEESGLLAARDELQDFADEVDRLRDALARLDKRVLRVASALGPQPNDDAMKKR